ncbi:MAG: 50S ribosomal protein L3 [Clostridia bacterium]|nr:50S ribosomal protein L3 [Clostridia bacterium]MDD4047349.1 50S ribosomal protein L3 [Clostridia bacterium]
MKAILGTKVGMTQVFDKTGRVIPVTVIEAGPCTVIQKKTLDTDGYNAIQVGFGKVKARGVNKPSKGHFDKGQLSPMRYLKEFRVEETDSFEQGQEIKVDLFSEGEWVDVSAISKGKGFCGVIKRHGMHRGPMEHGSKYHRGSGSLGAKGPARVYLGRKLPGRLGGERVTVQKLLVVKVDSERNLLLVRGAIPGAKKSLVTIKNSIKA